ncbi:MAG: hypothetical protein ACYCVZ_16035 [Streptosporangiaceae bacterium]
MTDQATPGPRTMSAAQWQRSVRLWRADGASEIEIECMGVGCPRHGNASMDYDGAPFCMACDAERTVAGALR